MGYLKTNNFINKIKMLNIFQFTCVVCNNNIAINFPLSPVLSPMPETGL